MNAIVICDNCGRKNRVPAVASGVPHCSNCHATLAWIAARLCLRLTSP